MNLFPVYPLFDLEPVKAEGCYVYDRAGNAYLDFYGGHAVISIGHSHPHFVQRLQTQLQALAFYSNSIQNPLQEMLATKLGQLSGLEDYQLFLCNSGAEANENALKLASFHNGRQKMIAFKHAFHGRTSAAVNVTDKESIKAPINKTFPVEFHDWNDLESVSHSVNAGDVCAVIIEGIQGIGGIHLPDAAFLEGLAKVCKTQDTVLILDEIQSGYGRSGHFFAFQQCNIQPDLVTTAKGMGNGFPIGGVLIHPSFEGTFGLLGTTFGGNHLACAAGLAVLEVMEAEHLMENAKRWGTVLMEELKDLPGLVDIRGMGLMIGLEFEAPVGAWRKELLFEHHIFTGSADNANVMRLLPPLSIGAREVDLLTTGLQTSVQKGKPV